MNIYKKNIENLLLNLVDEKCIIDIIFDYDEKCDDFLKLEKIVKEDLEYKENDNKNTEELMEWHTERLREMLKKWPVWDTKNDMFYEFNTNWDEYKLAYSVNDR